MGSRERKRSERRKRKRRSATGRDAGPVMARGYARAEEKNRAAREALDPLQEGERPGAVTVGAIVAAVIALIFIGSTAVALFGRVEVGGETPNPAPLALFAAAMVAMAYGMWRARYWAVLGFQAMLVLFMLAAAGGLLGVRTVLQAIGSLLMLGLAGTLFYFMIRAMARIQMPSRVPPEGPR